MASGAGLLLSSGSDRPWNDDAAVLALFEELALSAGQEILRHFTATIDVEHKSDSSPVTAADRASEKVILEGVRRRLPVLPCISEEEASAGFLPTLNEGEFLLIDPLDGTREFINRRPDFTVNIALIRSAAPVIGVVYAPALRKLYSGRPGFASSCDIDEQGNIGSRLQISARRRQNPPAILASRSHMDSETEAYLARFPGADVVTIGSSLKFCMVARGDADLYPRFGRTMQWDTAAGDAVLRAAGGRTLAVHGTPLTYGPRGGEGLQAFANPAFVAEGRASRT